MNIIADSIARIGVGYGPTGIATLGIFPQSQEARSGVNRLWLMQIQEESLRQDELRKKESESVEKKKEQSSQSGKARQKVKQKVKRGTSEFEIDRPVFRPLAPFARLPEQPNFEAISISIAQQVQVLISSYKSIRLEFIQAQSNDDEDVELLLLAA